MLWDWISFGVRGGASKESYKNRRLVAAGFVSIFSGELHKESYLGLKSSSFKQLAM